METLKKIAGLMCRLTGVMLILCWVSGLHFFFLGSALAWAFWGAGLGVLGGSLVYIKKYTNLNTEVLSGSWLEQCLVVAALAAAAYGFVTTSPTLALMSWVGCGFFLTVLAWHRHMNSLGRD